MFLITSRPECLQNVVVQNFSRVLPIGEVYMVPVVDDPVFSNVRQKISEMLDILWKRLNLMHRLAGLFELFTRREIKRSSAA